MAAIKGPRPRRMPDTVEELQARVREQDALILRLQMKLATSQAETRQARHAAGEIALRLVLPN